MWVATASLSDEGNLLHPSTKISGENDEKGTQLHFCQMTALQGSFIIQQPRWHAVLAGWGKKKAKAADRRRGAMRKPEMREVGALWDVINL